jgi:hypothetical protein
MSDHWLGQTQRDASASPHAPAVRRGNAAANSRAFLSIAGLGLVLFSACGKGAKGECPQLDICGGSPASDTPWKVTDYCQVPVVRPSQPSDVNDFTSAGMSAVPLAPTIAPPQPNPVVATQTTSGDWCSSLLYKPDDTIGNANLWHEAPQISADPAKPSTMIFGKDGTYLTKLILEVPQGQDFTHFARHCLIANGAPNPTCDKLAKGLTDFYKPVKDSVPPSFGNIMCADSSQSDGGCDCTYTYTVQVDDSGTWAISKEDNTLLLQDSPVLQFNGQTMNAQASTTMLQSSICASGNRLELSGVRGGSLSNIQGLRTLVLAPMM